jgi:hypothetical protein
MPYSSAVFEFIETPHFTRILDQYLDDDEYSVLQGYLNSNPEAGAIVPGSGGVRKVRWRAEGRGKRGGLRVIYFAKTAREEIWMLTMYGKNVRENIPAHVLRAMRKEIDDAQND